MRFAAEGCRFERHRFCKGNRKGSIGCGGALISWNRVFLVNFVKQKKLANGCRGVLILTTSGGQWTTFFDTWFHLGAPVLTLGTPLGPHRCMFSDGSSSRKLHYVLLERMGSLAPSDTERSSENSTYGKIDMIKTTNKNDSYKIVLIKKCVGVAI